MKLVISCHFSEKIKIVKNNSFFSEKNAILDKTFTIHSEFNSIK